MLLHSRESLLNLIKDKFLLVSPEFGLDTVLGTLGTAEMPHIFLEADPDQQHDTG